MNCSHPGRLSSSRASVIQAALSPPWVADAHSASIRPLSGC